MVLWNNHELSAYQYMEVRGCCAIQVESIALLKAVEFVQSKGIRACKFLTDCSAVADITTQLMSPQDGDWRAYT